MHETIILIFIVLLRKSRHLLQLLLLVLSVSKVHFCSCQHMEVLALLRDWFLSYLFLSSYLSRSLADRWGTTVDLQPASSTPCHSQLSVVWYSMQGSPFFDVVFPSFPLSASSSPPLNSSAERLVLMIGHGLGLLIHKDRGNVCVRKDFRIQISKMVRSRQGQITFLQKLDSAFSLCFRTWLLSKFSKNYAKKIVLYKYACICICVCFSMTW